MRRSEGRAVEPAVPSLDTSLKEDVFHPVCDSDVKWKFVRSGGPGGQNVNKVATAAELRFNVRESAALTPRQKEHILRESKKITGEGEIVISCSVRRAQAANRKLALEILNEHLAEVLKPKVERKPTEPPAESIEERLRKKRQRSKLKQDRQQRDEE